MKQQMLLIGFMPEVNDLGGSSANHRQQQAVIPGCYRPNWRAFVAWPLRHGYPRALLGPGEETPSHPLNG
jgi:hypothetical protein